MQKTKGFTFIELSIVVFTIGVLVTFVIFGSNIVESAKINSLQQEINNLSQAVIQFVDKYNSLPGDFCEIARLPSTTSDTLAGNCNGKVDTASERLQFWHHLYLAGLLRFEMDGTSTNVIAKGVSGGAPPSIMDGLGYEIEYLSDGRMAFKLSKFVGSQREGFFSPAEAIAFNKKFDSDDSAVDSIIADDTSSSGACSNTTIKDEVCFLKFTLPLERIIGTTSASFSVSQASRVSSTAVCGAGYVGKVMEIWDGSAWINDSSGCILGTCSDGTTVNSTKTVRCPAEYTGSVTYTCTTARTFKITANTCTPNTGACVNPSTSTASRTLSCPIGQAGSIVQTCSAGSWSTSSNTCADIACSPRIVGDPATSVVPIIEIPTVIAPACPSDGNYSPFGSPEIYSACQMPLTGSFGIERITGNGCMPVYGSCPTIGATSTFSCPLGQTGSKTKTCDASSTWQITTDSCTDIMCEGGFPVGSVKEAVGQSCSGIQTGKVLEVCIYDNNAAPTKGIWRLSTSNCN